MGRTQKRILIIKGINQYGVLSYMLETVAEELQRREEYCVQICTWDEMGTVTDQRWDICISCQAIDATFEVKADKYVTWLVDHPVHFYDRLSAHRDMENLWIGCVDKTHVEFLSKYMDQKHAFYLPHLGGKTEHIYAYEQRKIDVFFPASYVDVNGFEVENSVWLNGAIKVVADGAIEYLKNHNEATVEKSLEVSLERLGESVEKTFFVECMTGFGDYVDSYISKYFRQRVVQELLDAGINLTVAGKGWEHFKKVYQGPGEINILSENMSYEQVLACMGKSKMVLTVLPWFKDGSHERIASTLLNGAVCLTDCNRYTERLFGHSQAAILYDRNEPKDLVHKIQYYLHHGDDAARIAEIGRKIGEESVTVKNFVHTVLTEIGE